MICALSTILLLAASPLQAASTATVRNDVPADLKTLYHRMAEELDPKLKSGDVPGALEVTRGYVGRMQDADMISFLLDVQSSYLAAAGDYQGALVSMVRAGAVAGRAAPSRVYGEEWNAIRAAARWEEPEVVLRRAAAKHSVIMLSEAHHVPETRALGARLLPLLRERGFEYLAMETLHFPVPEAPKRVAVSMASDAASGYYFMDPQLAGLTREALRLGFKLVAYEDEESGRDREEAQARNLYERVLKDKPDAKVVVWAGYAHVYKRESPTFGKAMAQWVWELTGREPFTLYQVADALDPYFRDEEFYKPLVLDDPRRPRRALVLPAATPGLPRSKDGRPLVDGYLVHPPFVARAPGSLRPPWIVRKGLRRVAGVAGEGARFVQAYPSAEGTASAPADQMAVVAGRYELWLPQGPHILQVRGENGLVLSETTVP